MYEQRVLNLRKWVKESGMHRKALCESKGVKHQTVTNILTYPESRFTTGVARNLEEKFGMPEGYLDVEFDTDEQEQATEKGAYPQYEGTYRDYSRLKVSELRSPQVIKAPSNNMEPLIFENDLLLLDTQDIQVINGKVYAILYKNRVKVVRLNEYMDGNLQVMNENPVINDETINPEAVKEHIKVLGRVIERRGSGGF